MTNNVMLSPLSRHICLYVLRCVYACVYAGVHIIYHIISRRRQLTELTAWKLYQVNWKYSFPLMYRSKLHVCLNIHHISPLSSRTTDSWHTICWFKSSRARLIQTCVLSQYYAFWSFSTLAQSGNISLSTHLPLGQDDVWQLLP